jgi:hypothetical protein
MRFFPKGLNPLNFNKFHIGFILVIYNSKSREIWMLGQKRNFINLNLPTSMQSLGNFGLKKDGVLYFLSMII